MISRNTPVQLSAIIPVGPRHAKAADIYADYVKGLRETNLPYEIIFVLDGPWPEFSAQLDEVAQAGGEFTIIRLSRLFGESTALMAGFEQARGDIILTLPAYYQIEGEDISKLVAALDSTDVAMGRRFPRVGGPLEVLRRSAFHGLIDWVTGLRYSDLGWGGGVVCGAAGCSLKFRCMAISTIF
jgi:glycosyltransferase involved in cell wall biosynthesis